MDRIMVIEPPITLLLDKGQGDSHRSDYPDASVTNCFEADTSSYKET